ncbi:hypothetical protein R1sor_014194 [Riccia sorocarpa]|uniref:Uncharacterized protein n=1 Tax=Riccia sorocarpa TaxID=122646 RepID=A0ABD3H8Q3_9MARC
MDIYLEPLVEELKLLWDGVRAYEASTLCPREDRWFQLHAICMWTIHDIPDSKSLACIHMHGHTLGQMEWRRFHQPNGCYLHMTSDFLSKGSSSLNAPQDMHQTSVWLSPTRIHD